MANFYVPKGEEDFLSPFGPTMGYKKLSKEFVDTLNTKMNDQLEDFSDNLVGKVSQELLFTEEINALFLKEVSTFIGKYQNFSEQVNTFGRKRLDGEKYNYVVQIVNGWFVRQFENEYNPVHIHTGCRLSCVGYLSLPEGIEDEWEEDYKDHHPSNGHIQFLSGTSSGYTSTNFMVKPQVGDFYVFPNQLFHCVYPFKTKGERRSFSVNMNFVEVPKDKKDAKK